MSNSTTEEAIEETKKVSKHDFFFEKGLYAYVPTESFEENIFQGIVDGYNSNQGIDTTFDISYDRSSSFSIRSKGGKSMFYYGGYEMDAAYFVTITLTCKRKGTTIRIFVLVGSEGIEKVGQFPSLADIQFAEMGKKYRNVLDKELLINFKQAIGLNAHGVGAGAIVYLRKIFESLIFEAFTKNESAIGISETEFRVGKRMDEKVDLVKDYLPKELSEMRGIYSILSSGVHDLTEADCLKYFPVLKLSIKLILDKKIKQYEEEQSDKATKKMLADMIGNHSNNK